MTDTSEAVPKFFFKKKKNNGVYPTGVGWPVSGLLLRLVLLRRPVASLRVGREGKKIKKKKKTKFFSMHIIILREEK